MDFNPHVDPFSSELLFAGRQHVIERLHDHVSYGQSVVIIGGRRTGKTTLIRQLSMRPFARKVIVSDVSGWDLSSESAGLGALQSAVEGLPETRYARGGRNGLV